MSPYLVPDTAALCQHLNLIRQLAKSACFIIIIPRTGFYCFFPSLLPPTILNNMCEEDVTTYSYTYWSSKKAQTSFIAIQSFHVNRCLIPPFLNFFYILFASVIERVIPPHWIISWFLVCLAIRLPTLLVYFLGLLLWFCSNRWTWPLEEGKCWCERWHPFPRIGISKRQQVGCSHTFLGLCWI